MRADGSSLSPHDIRRLEVSQSPISDHVLQQSHPCHSLSESVHLQHGGVHLLSAAVLGLRAEVCKQHGRPPLDVGHAAVSGAGLLRASPAHDAVTRPGSHPGSAGTSAEGRVYNREGAEPAIEPSARSVQQGVLPSITADQKHSRLLGALPHCCLLLLAGLSFPASGPLFL